MKKARRKEHLHKDSCEDIQKQWVNFQWDVCHGPSQSSLKLRAAWSPSLSSSWGGIVALFDSSIFNKGLWILSGQRENSRWAGAAVLMFAFFQKIKHTITAEYIKHCTASEPEPEPQTVRSKSSTMFTSQAGRLFQSFQSAISLYCMFANEMYSSATLYIRRSQKYFLVCLVHSQKY